MPIWKIDQLQSEVSDIQNALSELRNATLSESEKKARENEIKSKAETAKQEIQWEINKLSWKTDAKSVAEKEKAETLLSTLTEILTLQLSIWSTISAEKTNTSPSPTSTEVVPVAAPIGVVPATTEVQWDEKKWFLWRTWKWIWEQWRATTWANFEKEPRKTALRALWFAATWVWAAALLVKWIKKLRDKRKEKKAAEEKDTKEDKKNEGGFWERPVWKTIIWIWTGLWILTWGYYVAHWAITWNWAPRDMFDWSTEKKLKFDDAMNYCKWAIANERGLEWAQYDMNLNYHEDTSEIEAYWERIKINKNSRKIEWLPVTFKTYDHMINTAIIIAFLKKHYSWMCSVKHPFNLSWARTWNINVNENDKNLRALDWTWKWWRITGIWGAAVLSILAWIFSGNIKVWASALTATWALWFIWWYQFDTNNTMSKHMPELDNEYWKKALAWYLNNLGCWEAREQTSEDVTESPIKPEVVACMQELQGAETELISRWWRRKLDAVQDPNNPSKYTIKAYSRDFSAEVSWEWENRKIKLLWISWWSPAIKMHPDQSEKIEKFFKLEMPLKEWIYLSNFLWYILEQDNNCIFKWNKEPFFYYWKRFWLSRPWIYFNDSSWDTYLLTEENFKWRMSTVFNNKDLLLNFLNKWIVSDNNVSIRRDPESKKN